MTQSTTLPLHPVRPDGLDALLAQLPAAAFVRAAGFDAKMGKIILLPPTATGPLGGALLGLGHDRSPYPFGAIATALPPETLWHLMPGDYDAEAAHLGALLGAYRYDRFKPQTHKPAELNAPIPDRAAIIARAINHARDLINTPANLLGPAELADAALALAKRCGAKAEQITGPALIAGYPALAAVGAGSDRPPHMVKLSWGQNPHAPLISLVGKGVVFDTGGYDLKPSSAMLRMKKDMGGAATMLGLAQAIMELNLAVRLELRIGCVENSVSGHAMRPLDVLNTRAGLTVEVGNTDAEGRLVLADLLSDAVAAQPDWLIDFATLTGAARTALGPDLPALFCNDDILATQLLTASHQVSDPLWRLPLWQDYAPWLDSPIADLNSVSGKPHAGAIIAALFLDRFVPASTRWAHIDTYAWNESSRPGRPEGGEAIGLRAALAAIENLISVTH